MLEMFGKLNIQFFRVRVLLHSGLSFKETLFQRRNNSVLGRQKGIQCWNEGKCYNIRPLI